MFTSWRTTLAGIVSILGGVVGIGSLLLSGDLNLTSPAWAAAIGGVITGIGLLHARDNKVSSEQAGAVTAPPPVTK